MALKFSCKECGQDIIVRYLKIGEVAKCMHCGAANPVPTTAVQTDQSPYVAPPPFNLEGEQTTETTQEVQPKAIEICFPDGQIQQYEEYNVLRDEIISGNVRRDYKARLVAKIGKTLGQDKQSKEKSWSTIDKISKVDFSLRVLYRPIWAHSMKWAKYSSTVLFVLLLLSNLWGYFRADTVLGVSFLIIIVATVLSAVLGHFRILFMGWFLAFILTNWSYNGALGFFGGNLLGCTVYAVIFGGTSGMIIGTILGHFKKKKLLLAPDAEPEGMKPYIIGLVLPLIFLGAAIPVYLFWILPKLISLVGG